VVKLNAQPLRCQKTFASPLHGLFPTALGDEKYDYLTVSDVTEVAASRVDLASGGFNGR
jgi:hypothetical protein